jgi:hypothetical protein
MHHLLENMRYYLVQIPTITGQRLVGPVMIFFSQHKIINDQINK